MLKTARNLCLLALVSLLPGCLAARNMAVINDSAEPQRIFTSPQPEDNYQLYYHGPDYEPIAYLALDPDYRLKSDFWYPLKLNPTVQKQVTSQVNVDSFRRGSQFIGKEIVLPDGGETIGYVLSSYHWITAWLDDQDNKTIIIPPPDLASNQPVPLTFSRTRPQ